MHDLIEYHKPMKYVLHLFSDLSPRKLRLRKWNLLQILQLGIGKPMI